MRSSHHPGQKLFFRRLFFGDVRPAQRAAPPFEPFSGLDVLHIKALENLLSLRQEQGLATILCTHIAPYAAKLCERAAVLEKGQFEELSGWAAADQGSRVELVETSFFPQSE